MALGCGGLLIAPQNAGRSPFHIERKADSDLEISGKVQGIRPGESRFVAREYLLGLPQVDSFIEHSEVLAGRSEPGIPVRGVYLDVLANSLGASSEASSVAAICADGYTSIFPEKYIQQHRPIFVLTIEGLTPHEWAVRHHSFDAGPYFVGYQHFVPSFQVLSHSDRPAEPDGMTKIVFESEEQLYAGIVPGGSAGVPQMELEKGYLIARQNCYRCHNAGTNGGTKASVSWKQIGAVAKKEPQRFKKWVSDPQSIDRKSKMPPNKDYDQPTLSVLQRYFASFAQEGE